MWCMVNGLMQPLESATISVQERGWTLADGCFETIRLGPDGPHALADHLRRLATGLTTLALPALDAAALAEQLARLQALNGITMGLARIQVSRGVQAGRGWPPPADLAPTTLLTLHPLAALPGAPTPVRGLIVDITRRNEWSPLSRFKALASYPDHILAAQAARAEGYAEALLLNTAGTVACAATANIWALHGMRLTTPPVAAGALPGVVRAWLLAHAAAWGLEVAEAPLTVADARSADALWLTNVGRGLQPLTLADSAAPPGALTLRAYAAVRAWLEAPQP